MPVFTIAAIVAIFAAFAAALAWAQFHARPTDSLPAHAGLFRSKRRPLLRHDPAREVEISLV